MYSPSKSKREISLVQSIICILIHVIVNHSNWHNVILGFKLRNFILTSIWYMAEGMTAIKLCKLSSWNLCWANCGRRKKVIVYNIRGSGVRSRRRLKELVMVAKRAVIPPPSGFYEWLAHLNPVRLLPLTDGPLAVDLRVDISRRGIPQQ